MKSFHVNADDDIRPPLEGQIDGVIIQHSAVHQKSAAGGYGGKNDRYAHTGPHGQGQGPAVKDFLPAVLQVNG